MINTELDPTQNVNSNAPQAPSKTKKLSALVIVLFAIMLSCGLCTGSILLLGFILPSEMSLSYPENNVWTTTEPVQTVQFYCNGVEGISLNKTELGEEEKDKLCGNEGYELNLINGENNFVFEGLLDNEKTEVVEITITFDEDAYNERLAQEEQQLLEEEQRQKEEQEADQKAKAQEWEDWKVKYDNVVNEIIAVSLTKSEEMTGVLGNGTDAYQTRNQAISYKDYFLKNCNKNLEDELSPVPVKVQEDVKNLNSYYSDFCMYNEFFARRVVDYLESESTSEQYNHLDQMTYYQSMIIDAKIGINTNTLLIDEIILNSK